MSRSAFYLGLLRTAVLVNLAFTARLYDILRREPTFFTVRRAGPLEIVALVAVLSLLLPGVFLLVEALARGIGPRTAKIVHRALVAVLAALVSLAALRGLEVLPWPLLLAAAAAAGGLAAWIYSRFAGARSLLTLLWPTLLIFPAWMLLASPARVAFSGGFDPPAAEVRVARSAPLVLIVFDEFCGMSLATADAGPIAIDARRFPNFAGLAADGTWFRNATTMSPSTHEALPTILTGRFPKDPSHPPEVYEYPENIFRLLGRSHATVAFETETRLCPPHLRHWPAPPQTLLGQLHGMCIDLAVVELHLLLPPRGPIALPSLNGRWSNFLDQDQKLGSGHAGFQRRGEQFDELIARMQPPAAAALAADDRQPGFYFAHVMLPHVPYTYLPCGESYEFPLAREQQESPNMTHGVIGLERDRERWVDDRAAVAQAAARYLLQVEFVDRLIGRLVGHLKQVGLYDDTLIVITADHGVSFRPGDLRREVTPGNHADILSIPLFIKVPHQRRGATSDRNVQSADIVPTIADVLGVEVPWRLDGVSAFDASQQPLAEKGLTPEESWARRQIFDATLPEKAETCRHLAELVGRRDDAFDLYSIGPCAYMAGRAVEEFSQGEVPEYQAELVGDVRTHCLAGRLVGPGLPLTAVDIALAVNGRIAAVARTSTFADFDHTWTALLPPSSVSSGQNDLAVYVISLIGGRRVLLPLKLAR